MTNKYKIIIFIIGSLFLYGFIIYSPSKAILKNFSFSSIKNENLNFNEIKRTTSTSPLLLTSQNKFKDYFNGSYEPRPFKYVIYTCAKHCGDKKSCVTYPDCGGLGDRYKGITHAFLLALITNRTLLINVKSPCKLQENLESNVIKWDENLDAIIEKIDNGQMSSVRFDFFNNGFKQIKPNKDLSQDTLGINLMEYEYDTDAFIVAGNRMVSQLLYDRYHKRLTQLGFNPASFDKINLFRTAYRLLFKLPPRLQAKYDEFLKNAKPTENGTLICAQLRIGGKATHFYDTTRIQKEHTKYIWDFIKTNMTSLFGSDTKNYRLYVTSDHEYVVDEAKSIFGPNQVIASEGIVTHIDLDKAENDCQRYDRTYLDFHKLQNCDMGVVCISGFAKLGIFNTPAGTSTENIYVFNYDFTKNEPQFSKFSDDAFQGFKK